MMTMDLKDTLQKVESKDCSIEIFGLGYVGFPLSVRLATSGFKIRGIDINPKRIQRLQEDSLENSEFNLRHAFLKSKKNGNLVFSDHSAESDNPKIGIICVPTPIANKNVDSNVFVYSAITNFLDTCKKGDVIIIESSVRVGTTEEAKKLVETKGFEVGKNFGVCFCPERIDPLNKKWKLENIPRVIYSSDHTSYQIVQIIYRYVNNSNLIQVSSPKIAEIVKSFENAYRLVNISLVNELSILCSKLNINVSEVISAASTKPFGFTTFFPSAGAGGHCIPKDPIFLSELAKTFGVEFGLIEEALKTNSNIPAYIASSIEQSLTKLNLEKSVIVCGLSYKPNIEDMRDSPGFKIVNELVQRKFTISAYDPYYNDNLVDKYLYENNLTDLKFKVLRDLNDDSIKGFNCICIVQKHDITKFRLSEIYDKSLVPLIYDCQNKKVLDEKSKKTINVFES